MISDSVSKYIEDMFPSLYKDSGGVFLQLVKAYYEWLEQKGNTEYHVQSMHNYFDIDNTIDEFIDHFKSQYLANLTIQDTESKRTILKHNKEFLTSKGSEENIKLMLKLLYNEDATIYRPAENILRPSDGVWTEPEYIEISITEKNQDYVGRTITGSVSEAHALVERVVRKSISGSVFDVLYISNRTGNFVTGDIITTDGVLDNCPVMIGSMTSVDIISGGRDYAVGEVVDINSKLTGKRGKGIVTDVGTATGRVTFDLEDGGFGFTENAEVYISDKVLNCTFDDPEKSFTLLEEVYQTSIKAYLISVVGSFTKNSLVEGLDASSNVVFTGHIVGSVTQANGSEQEFSIIPESGDYTLAASLRQDTEIHGEIYRIITTTSTGILIGVKPSSPIPSSTHTVGIAKLKGTIYFGFDYTKVTGRLSNTVITLQTVSGGRGAGFDIVGLTNKESIFINRDRLNDKNVFGVPYMDVQLLSSGFIEDVKIPQLPNTDNYLYRSGGGSEYTVGDTEQLTLTSVETPTEPAIVNIIVADGVVNNIFVDNLEERGVGYMEGQELLFIGKPKKVNGIMSSSTSSIFISDIDVSLLYVGLCVSGPGIEPETYITYIDKLTSTIILTKPPKQDGKTIITFPATGYISVNESGSIQKVNIRSNGYGYEEEPIIEVVSDISIKKAKLKCTIENGVVVDTRVESIGSGYNFDVTASAYTTGIPATFTINIDSGYGFPKDPNSDIDTVLYDALTSLYYEIGSISKIGNMSLGENYTQDPFVLILEPVIYGYNKLDLRIQHDKKNARFKVGELITQNIRADETVLRFNELIGSDMFIEGELVRQGDVVGIVNSVSYDNISGTISLTEVSGRFERNQKIVGERSGVVANVTYYGLVSVAKSVKGRVVNVGPDYIDIQRSSFSVNFAKDYSISGSSSKEIANVLFISEITDSKPSGFNAYVSAEAGIVSGFIKSIKIFDSGFSYKNHEPITLSNGVSEYVGVGYVNVTNQGVGEGFFENTSGFLNGEYNYIHDNNYWQEYSYEVRTGISLDEYAKTLKDLCHTTGTKFFGSVEKLILANTEIKAIDQELTYSVEAVLRNGTGYGFYKGNEITYDDTLIGILDSNVTGECNSNKYVDFVVDDEVYIPNKQDNNAIGILRTSTYFGEKTDESYYMLDDVTGPMLPDTGTIEAYTNTAIITCDTQWLNVGDKVWCVDTNIINEFDNSVNTQYQGNERNTKATYKNSYGLLSVSDIYGMRPWYDDKTSEFKGLLNETYGTNLILHSQEFNVWNKTKCSVVVDDILDLFGKQTVDKIIGTTEYGEHFVSQTYSSFVKGNRYTFSCFVRRSELNFVTLRFPSNIFGDVKNTFDIGGGVFEMSSNSDIDNYANAWYRVSITAIANESGTGDVDIIISSSKTNLVESFDDNYSGLHVFGAQLEIGKKSTYIPTIDTIGIRDKDEIYYTELGWDLANRGSGTVKKILDDNTLVLQQHYMIDYEVGSNTVPFTTSGYIVQRDDAGNVLARSIMACHDNRGITVAPLLYKPLKSAGKFMEEDKIVLSYIPSKADNEPEFNIGDKIYQQTNSGLVSGVISYVGARKISVNNLSGEFELTTDTSNTIYTTDLSNIANVVLVENNEISIKRMYIVNRFNEGSHILSTRSRSVPVINKSDNKDARIDTEIIPIFNTINTVRISDYLRGNDVVGNQITNSNTGSTAIVQSIE